MDMDLSETETMRPALRSATPALDGGPRLQEAAPAKITAATRQGNLRVALVGAGYVAQFHRDVLAETPGVNLVAVCDADADRARAAARQWGIPNAVGAVEELRDLAIDIAHVLVPPDLHVKVTRALLEMGIGVLIEKPMARPSAGRPRSTWRSARDSTAGPWRCSAPTARPRPTSATTSSPTRRRPPGWSSGTASWRDGAARAHSPGERRRGSLATPVSRWGWAPASTATPLVCAARG